MARHIPTGQPVAVKQTNLDECTEEELLQLLVSWWRFTLKVSIIACSPSRCVYTSFCLKPQSEVLLSRRFRHPNLLTSRLVFGSCCKLWVLTPLMAYGQPPCSSIHLLGLLSIRFCISMSCPFLSPSSAGSADALLRTYFPDGMSESLIAYLLYGALKALEYLHRMGYVHRSVGDGKTLGETSVLPREREKCLKILNVCPRIPLP